MGVALWLRGALCCIVLVALLLIVVAWHDHSRGIIIADSPRGEALRIARLRDAARRAELPAHMRSSTTGEARPGAARLPAAVDEDRTLLGHAGAESAAAEPGSAISSGERGPCAVNASIDADGAGWRAQPGFSSDARAAGTGTQPVGASRGGGGSVPYVVLGVANAPKNSGHRQWIRATWMGLPNVNAAGRAGGVRAFFMVGMLQPDGTAHPRADREALWRESRTRGDMVLLNARETKPPGEKMIAFFRYCVAAHAFASFCVKTDDDTYVHTVRLEANLRGMWSMPHAPRIAPGGGPLLYVGATLWASYVERSFEARAAGGMIAPLRFI